jgi:hypothetical protein
VSTPAARAVALLLVLIVGAGHTLALRDGGHVSPASPWGLVELLVPGLFVQDGQPAVLPFATPSPPPGHSLAWAALRHTSAGESATMRAPYVGMLPLWLALLWLLPAPGRRGLPALARLGLLGLAVAGGLMLQQSFVLVGGLALAAAAGLRRIASEASPGDRSDSGPQLVVSAACVLLTAALIALALRTGSSGDAQAVQPLLEALDPAQRPAWDAGRLAPNAAHLRAVLDRSALAAFAGMTALLLHLKSRARWSAALLLAVTAADVASVAAVAS